jgi:hypothetical protein
MMRGLYSVSALCGLLVVWPLPAATATAAQIPPLGGEQVHYVINWPSGLSLGEANLSGTRSAAKLVMGFQIDASIPGFTVSDQFRSESSPEFCSASFDKHIRHGSRIGNETTTFTSDGSATRKTVNGGDSTFSTASCARDALTYLFFVRSELSQGRLPPDETVYFGAPYRIHLDFAGTEQIQVAGKAVEADKLNATAQGDASSIQFEMYFLKDAARTLAMVKVPFSMGTFSMVVDR